MNSIETTEKREFLKALEQMAKGDDIKAAVAREAFSYETPEHFFSDLSQYGCMSGLV